ncbi:MAG: DnaA regulatory inactivator Hda [Proteobacteria bacterium]|nr:DnaA regulatory inactivator Hda [Pseudomonadota bacterium]HQR03698.1 DnaA regulatory inactivator Hda [Rhodocyclaceae bacterium]
MTPLQRQLLLGLRPDQPRTLENFVAGRNGELLRGLARLTVPENTGSYYLWGPPGCGRSHLLAAVTRLARRPAVLSSADELGHTWTWQPGSLLAVDDVHTLNDDGQATLFRAFIAARNEGLSLLLSGPVPPLELTLREDLRTRIGQCLIYEIQPLSDTEKAATLAQHARERGMALDEAIVPWLLRHGRRDLPSLLATLDALDHASLELKRPPTLPLLREVLQLRLETE